MPKREGSLWQRVRDGQKRPDKSEGRMNLIRARGGWVIAFPVVILLAVVLDVRATPPHCLPGVPQPPLIVVLPDGTEVPAGNVTYHPDSRMVIVTAHPGIFCNGFEAPAE